MKKYIFCLVVILLAASCTWEKSTLLHTQDENIQISLPKTAYSLTDTVELKISVIGKGIDLSAGWCSSYFELRMESGWERADPCVLPDDPNLELMPSPRASGTVEKLSLSIKNFGLKPGLYRYKLSYRTNSQDLFLYSPEFSVGD
jgi:hypothetical protein